MKRKHNFFGIISLIILMIVFSFNILLLMTFQEKYKYFGYFMTFLFQILISVFLICVFIPDSIDGNNKNQMPASFITNLIFSLSTTMLVFNNTYFNEILFQILSLMFIVVLIFILNNFTRIETKNDVSLLKATNYFVIAFWSAIIFLLEKHLNNENENVKGLINFYYLLPLLVIQGFYELLDRKIKKLIKNQNIA